MTPVAIEKYDIGDFATLKTRIACMPIETNVRAEKYPWTEPKLSLKIPTPTTPIPDNTTKKESAFDT